MLINLIVFGITAFAVAVFLAWLTKPSWQASIEVPKYDVANWDR